jgi:type 1 glutamine amidotransferase
MFVHATLLAAALLAAAPAPAPAAPRTVLVVSEARGFVHDSIPDARAALRLLDAREPALRVQEVGAAALTGARLSRADAVVLANTTGDLPVDRRALARFVRRGGGLAGFHSATDTFPSWPRWEALIGGRLERHDPAGTVETVRMTRPRHPAVRGLPERFSLAEEFYVHAPGVARRARVLARWGPERRPLVWVRSPGRGRVFYDALGHIGATWSDPRQQALVRSGLRWVLRLP